MSSEGSVHHAEEPPLLVVLSGPSGVGKDAAINCMRGLDRPWHFVVTATTRPRRSNERDGVDYVFLESQEFQGMMERGEFLECAQVYGNWYGVPRSHVREALSKGLDTMLKIDVQGAATIKSLVPDAVFIFLAPPSMSELQQRLSRRGSESPIDLKLRARVSWKEMECRYSFDYTVINRDGRLDEAVARVDAIITAEKCRTQPRNISV